jgi:putative ABC transport system permease protein
MRFLRAALARVRGLFVGTSADAELREELEAHLEMEIAEYMRRGMSPEDARRLALRNAGGLTQAAESVRDQRGMPWLEDVWRDFTLALRSLRRNRGFAIAVILTLALGIGANTAMFTVLRGTLLRGLPNRDGEHLVYLRQSTEGAGRENVLFSVPEVNDYRTGSTTLSAIAQYSSMTFVLERGNDDPVRVRTGIVSGNYFDVMGLSAVAGRLTSDADDGAAAVPVVVLSYPFFLEHFGGDRHVVGQTVRINGKVATVVGIAQAAPLYPQLTDVFVNLVTSPHHLGATMATNRSHRMTELFARLRPGTSVDQARDEITRIAGNVVRDHPESYAAGARYTISVMPLRSAINERASLTLWLLMGGAGFVLLIACANVANLTLMRGVGREREMLVRAALGAARWRLRRLLLVENLTLALLGGALGVLVAFAGLRLLVAFAAQLTPRANEIRVDGVVLGVSLATSVLVAIALSFASRVGGGWGGSTAPLIGVTHRSTFGRARQRFQQTLVVAQVAVCMVLLTGAGLLVRTLAKLHSVETGVHADHALTLYLPVLGSQESYVVDAARNAALFEQMRDRVAALPEVQVASLAIAAPLERSIIDFDIKADGFPVNPNEPPPHAQFKAVDPYYFAAAGIPVIAGRAVQTTDKAGPTVVMLNASLAKQLFGTRDPVGQRVAWTGEILKLFGPSAGAWRTVVGVTGDTRDDGLDNQPTSTMYQVFGAGFPVFGATLIVRTRSDPAAIAPTVMRAVRELNPRQLIEQVRTLEQIRDDAVAPRRLNAMFIASFGLLALAIAMVGIAGVLAFSVSSRTSEIGIRMSFGADAARVRRMILGEGGVLLGIGLVIGVVGGLLATRALAGLLFGVAPDDPVTFGVVALALTTIGLAACWVPATRAARVDPAVALRSE